MRKINSAEQGRETDMQVGSLHKEHPSDSADQIRKHFTGISIDAALGVDVLQDVQGHTECTHNFWSKQAFLFVQ